MRIELTLHQQHWDEVLGAGYARLKRLAILIEMSQAYHLGQCTSKWQPLKKLGFSVNGELIESVLGDTAGEQCTFEWYGKDGGDLISVPFVGEASTLIYFGLQCPGCAATKQFVCTVCNGDLNVTDATTKGPVCAVGWCVVDLLRTTFIRDCDGLLELYPKRVSGPTLLSAVKGVDAEDIVLSVDGEIGGVCARTFDDTYTPGSGVLSVATTLLMCGHKLTITCGKWTKMVPLVFLTASDTHYVYLDPHHVFSIKVQYRPNRRDRVSLATPATEKGGEGRIARPTARSRQAICATVAKSVSKVSAPKAPRPGSAPPLKRRAPAIGAKPKSAVSPRRCKGASAHPYLGRAKDLFGLMPRNPGRQSTTAGWYQEMERKPVPAPGPKVPSFQGEWLFKVPDGRYLDVANETLILGERPAVIKLERAERVGEYLISVSRNQQASYAHVHKKSRVVVLGQIAEIFLISQPSVAQEVSTLGRQCIHVRTQDDWAICEQHNTIKASASVSAVLFELERRNFGSQADNFVFASEDRVDIIQRWRKKVLEKQQQLDATKVSYRKALAAFGMHHRRFNQLVGTAPGDDKCAVPSKSAYISPRTDRQCVGCGGPVKCTRRYCEECAQKMEVCVDECSALYAKKLELLGRLHRSEIAKQEVIEKAQHICFLEETREERLNEATERLQIVVRVRAMQLAFELQKELEEALLARVAELKEEYTRKLQGYGEQLRIAEERSKNLSQELSDKQLEIEAILLRLAT